MYHLVVELCSFYMHTNWKVSLQRNLLDAGVWCPAKQNSRDIRPHGTKLLGIADFADQNSSGCQTPRNNSCGYQTQRNKIHWGRTDLRHISPSSSTGMNNISQYTLAAWHMYITSLQYTQFNIKWFFYTIMCMFRVFAVNIFLMLVFCMLRLFYLW